MTCDDISQFLRTGEECRLLVVGRKEILELNGNGAKITIKGLSYYLPIIFTQLHNIFASCFCLWKILLGVILVTEEKEMMQFEKQLPFAQVI